MLSGMLFMVAISMVITLIPGSWTATANANAGVLAEVGDPLLWWLVDTRELTTVDVQEAMRDYFRNQDINAATLAMLARQVVNNQIDNLVLLAEAEDLGLTADEEELADWLKRQMPFLFPDGNFQPDEYRAFVAQRFQKTIPQFEKEVHRSLIVDVRLRRMVTDNVIVTDEELKDLYRAQNEMTKIEFVKITPESFEASVEPTEERLREFFESQRQAFRIPEMRTVKLMTLDTTDLPEIEPSESEIERYYRQNRQRYEVSESIRASHILFMTEGKSEEEQEELKEKAEEVLNQIRQGADFAELAKEHSDDTATAEKGGDLGWVARGQMVPTFEKEAFALEAGETSNVITTQYGYHIIKVHEKRSAHTQSLEEVRDQIRQELIQDRAYSARMRRVDEAVATARKFGTDMEAAGQELNLEVTMLENLKRTDSPTELAELGDIMASLFAVGEGEVVTSNQDETTAIAVVTEIKPSREAEFEEVREQVLERYVQTESRRLAEERAREVAEAAKERSLQAAANQFGLKRQTSDFVKRSDSIPELGRMQLLGEEAFSAAPDTVAGPVRAGANWAVYRVVERQPADMAAFEDAREELLRQQEQAKKQQVFDLYKAEVRRRFEEAGRIRRYDDRIEAYVQALARST